MNRGAATLTSGEINWVGCVFIGLGAAALGTSRLGEAGLHGNRGGGDAASSRLHKACKPCQLSTAQQRGNVEGSGRPTNSQSRILRLSNIFLLAVLAIPLGIAADHDHRPVQDAVLALISFTGLHRLLMCYRPAALSCYLVFNRYAR